MKKLLAVILSVCLTLAVCGAAFAAEKEGTAKAGEAKEKAEDKLSDYVDNKSLSAILSTLNRLSKLSGEDPTADYEGDDGYAEYLYQLGYGDVLGSGKYSSGVTDYLENLLSVSDNYLEGTLTEKEFFDLISRGSGKTDNLFSVDEDVILGSDDDDLFTLDDIKSIVKELGVEEELEDEDYESAMYGLLFIMRMMEIYYWDSMDEISALEVLYTLYVISELYDDEELEDFDVKEIVELLGLEEAVEIAEAAEIAGKVYQAVEETAEEDEEAEEAEEDSEASGGQSAAAVSHSITVSSHPAWVSVTVQPTSAAAGETINVTLTADAPANAERKLSIMTNDSGFGQVTIPAGETGASWSFTMPDSNEQIDVTESAL